MAEDRPKVVLDTNILVAAGFNSDSHSARLVALIRNGRLEMIWNDATRQESRLILQKIPPLNWSDFEGFFTPAGERGAGYDLEADWVHQIDDPADRKFAALAEAANATLISNDDHLLSVRQRLPLEINTPTEFIDSLEVPS